MAISAASFFHTIRSQLKAEITDIAMRFKKKRLVRWQWLLAAPLAEDVLRKAAGKSGS
jgi:hypothetical protein